VIHKAVIVPALQNTKMSFSRRPWSLLCVINVLGYKF